MRADEKVMTITSHKLSTDEICAGQEVEINIVKAWFKPSSFILNSEDPSLKGCFGM